MRIGIFSECYHPVLNGVVISIDTFKDELEKRGHKFFIFTTQCPGNNEQNPHIKRFPCMIPFPPKGGRYPISWPRLARVEAGKISHLNLDLIHSQHLLGLGHLGLKIGKVLRIPTILTYHTLLAEYTHYVPLFGSLVRAYLISQSRQISNQYDQIVTPSPSMKKILRDYGVRRPIEAIPTGVNVNDFQKPISRKELESKWQIPQKAKLLLYVSRIAREKNVDFLLEAVRQLTGKRKDFYLLLIGGGPELEEFRKMVAGWRLEKRIVFTDMLPKKETNRYYGAADIFVFPSITETQGIVITEAMAAGIPAVAINIMGPSDLIQDGVDGFLVPLKLEPFRAKIEGLLDDESLRQKMGKKARQNAQKFSVETSADKMEGLYEKVSSNHRP